MLRRDLIYSQASQPIAQHFLFKETRMRLLRALIKSQNGFLQFSNKFDPASIIETRMRFELIKNGVADRYLNLSVTLSFILRKEWESNPHESLTPNGFQNRGHHLLACPSIINLRRATESNHRCYYTNSFSKRAQQTNICLLSYFTLFLLYFLVIAHKKGAYIGAFK